VISDILLVAGCGVLAAALRSFGHPVMVRLGAIGMVVTSFLAGWLLGGSVALGCVFASTWFLLPWLEILTRVRRLRMPIDRRLELTPPPARSVFPMFSDLTEEMESDHFVYVEDVGWSHDETRQFIRIFQKPESRTLGAICLIEQNEIAFYYVSLTSRTKDGRVFMTWNYPFAYGLRIPPNIVLNRVAGEGSFGDLAAEHTEFLSRSGVDFVDLREPSSETARVEIQTELRQQLDHNIACGLLKRDGADMIRYSVRGMFFLWFQFLRDFVRIS
jgi:hypothetical protein